jgi:hypothetical protein
MSLRTLIAVVAEALPGRHDDRQLATYQFTAVLKKHIRAERDRDLVQQFVVELA